MRILIDRLAYPAAVTAIAFVLLAPSAKAESVKIWPILKEQAFGDRAHQRRG